MDFDGIELLAGNEIFCFLKGGDPAGSTSAYEINGTLPVAIGTKSQSSNIFTYLQHHIKVVSVMSSVATY